MRKKTLHWRVKRESGSVRNLNLLRNNIKKIEIELLKDCHFIFIIVQKLSV